MNLSLYMYLHRWIVEDNIIKKNVMLLENHKYDNLLKMFFKDLLEYSRMYQKELLKVNSVGIKKDF